ncbi:hypothetical protein [Phyllobacterium sp. SB3]|uniref:hypothetical protein n=1 Tax=Phyllobacterium sp. SB3 TaxID=3156073 RepID=UPI0032AFBAD1
MLPTVVNLNKSIEAGDHHNEVIGGNMRILVGGHAGDGFKAGLVNNILKALQYKTQYIKKLPIDLFNQLSHDQTSGRYELYVGSHKYGRVEVSSTEQIGLSKTSTVDGIRSDITRRTHYTYVGEEKVTETLLGTTIMSGEYIQHHTGEVQVLYEKDGSILIRGKSIKIEAEEIEMTGSKSIKLKSQKIDLN